MSNITFKDDSPRVKVFLENKFVGSIREVDDGYAYYPNGSKEHGFVFKTIEEVKNDICGK